jgi:hypothetical protein
VIRLVASYNRLHQGYPRMAGQRVDLFQQHHSARQIALKGRTGSEMLVIKRRAPVGEQIFSDARGQQRRT